MGVIVGGVGAHPVREVGRERPILLIIILDSRDDGVADNSHGVLLALAPRYGIAGCLVVFGIVADVVEALAHEGGVLGDGGAVGEVHDAVDVGGEGGEGGGRHRVGGCVVVGIGGGADGEARALLEGVARATVDARELALEEEEAVLLQAAVAFAVVVVAWAFGASWTPAAGAAAWVGCFLRGGLHHHFFR